MSDDTSTDPMSPMPRRPSEPGRPEMLANARAILARRVVYGAVALALVVMLAVSTYTALLVRETQEANTPTLKNAAAAAKAAKDSARDSAAAAHGIADCTTPGRACWQRGKEQTAAAVGDIADQNALSAAAATSCAKDKPDATFAEVYRCTVARVNGTTPAKRTP